MQRGFPNNSIDIRRAGTGEDILNPRRDELGQPHLTDNGAEIRGNLIRIGQAYDSWKEGNEASATSHEYFLDVSTPGE